MRIGEAHLTPKRGVVVLVMHRQRPGHTHPVRASFAFRCARTELKRRRRRGRRVGAPGTANLRAVRFLRPGGVSERTSDFGSPWTRVGRVRNARDLSGCLVQCPPSSPSALGEVSHRIAWGLLAGAFPLSATGLTRPRTFPHRELPTGIHPLPSPKSWGSVSWGVQCGTSS